MTHSPAAPQRAPRRHSSRRMVGWIIGAVVIILVACVAWVGIRSLIAKNDLQTSISLVSKIKSEIGAGDVPSARATTQQLAKKVHSARDLTGDPIFRAAEIIPLVGPNLTAFREAASIVSDVTDRSIMPLASAAGSINLASFKPVNGAVSLQPLVAIAPTVTKANAALQSDLIKARAIDTSGTVSIVNKAVDQLTDALAGAGDITDAASRAVRLLPPMMGQNGPRNYVVLFQNNAEARSTGGISGALALIHVDNGAISLARQASSQDFPHYTTPVMALPPETEKIYSTLPGEYIQDVNLTPQFPLAAQLARQMWADRFGTEVDGVLAFDPVALSYLLQATGPVTLATGDQLNSGNAVQLLLSDVYARYSDPTVQDEFFASAAAEVFAKLAGGQLDPTAMVTALGKAASEHRILIWSSDAGEQKQLAETTLAGMLPVSSNMLKRFGVYLNDRTMGKMDYYLHTSIGLGQAVCRNDKRPTYAVDVTLNNTVTAAIASTLSTYVTGATNPGNISTTVAVFAPPGATLIGATSEGKPYPLNGVTLDGHPGAQFPVELHPGQASTVQLQFLGKAPSSAVLGADSTPGVYVTGTHNLEFTCKSALK